MKEKEEDKGTFSKLFIKGLILAMLAMGVINECNKPPNYTALMVSQDSDKDSVLAYLTLTTDTNYVTDVNGIFGITNSGSQGSFWVKKDTVYSYLNPYKPISGNISFGTPPINCPTDEFRNGANLFEFTLNNSYINKKAEETIDISNVAGVNCIGKFTMSSDWVVYGKKIDSVQNNDIYNNFKNKGVYPFKCDVCTASLKPPKCLYKLKTATHQEKPICNVSRKSKFSEGYVRITFLKYTD